MKQGNKMGKRKRFGVITGHLLSGKDQALLMYINANTHNNISR